MKGNISFFEQIKLIVCQGYQAGANALLGALQFLLFSRNDRPGKILVFRTGSIGDSICAFPALHAIRRQFPNSQLHILTTAGTRSPVSMERLLDPGMYDAIIDYHGHTRRQLFSLVRSHRYDLVIELSQNMASLWPLVRNIFFFRLAGIPSGWGWNLATVLMFRQVQERLVRFPSETERLLSILARNGVQPQGENAYPLRMTREAEYRVTALLTERNLPQTQQKLVALVPGAKRPQNRYPLDRFAVLAQKLVDKGYSVVVIGGEEDRETGIHLERIAQVYSFAGKLSPIESAVLMRRCSFAVTNDTGPMHLSYAAGTPVVALFSSRDFPNKWFPPKGSITLRNNDVHCSLCLSETCQDNICMKGISMEQVLKAVDELEGLTRPMA